MVQVKFTNPRFSWDEAERIAREHFGIDGKADELPSERDQNYLILTKGGDQFVLKIANEAESRSGLELQNHVVTSLAAALKDIGTPSVVPSLSGDTLVTLASARGSTHLVRVLTWVPGEVLARTKPHSPALLRSLGAALGSLDLALALEAQSEESADLKWDLTRASWIRFYFEYLEPDELALVEPFLATYETEVLPILPSLPAGLLYNDANDHNVLCRDGVVSGLIDFGDLQYGPRVCELAIGIAYAILGKADPIAAAAHVVSGYHEAYPLTEAELAVLFPLVCTRLCVSVANSSYQRHEDPTNTYLMISSQNAWEALRQLEATSPRYAYYAFRAACGFEPCPATTEIVAWLRTNQPDFGPVVEVDLATDSIVLDLSVGSTELGTLRDIQDLALFTHRVFSRMRRAGKRAAIGRYDEPRLLYTSELFVSLANDGLDRRTLHVGIDVFMEAGSSVLAPLDGVVVGSVDNAGSLNYGPTIILEHAIPGGPTFCTLYGHLSRESVRSLKVGAVVRKGDRIATMGDERVNGGWAPHLHFQIVPDLLHRTGDFPGVAPVSQRTIWLSLAPDPNLILQIPDHLFPARPAPVGTLLDQRKERLGYNLSVAYREPLHIVRGYMQYLYDANGRRYLDAVNNVPHVGHSHPRVVAAGQAQMAVLNTNSRYLHENVLRYAERLAATLPAPLKVCYFVNSGSEASELALRLARAHTRSKGTVVLDGAYHGNSSALIDISPYKYDGKGGAGEPGFVRKVPMPDLYRGAFRRGDSKAGSRYAASVDAALRQLTASGFERASFIAESLMGSSGQIVFPVGFLRTAYAHVRATGGVCIADEVQVGFGRVGSHFWGFETQGVVPDIVVMGKPMGNGHPMGAVVTTPEIAASFDNGMEYFSTFGGNPVSCAIGLAVLDVLEDEKLQANALRVGEYLRNGFKQLAKRHEIIGDVRGLGLFVGVEFVLNRATLEPAPVQTAYITNRLKERGVLVSIDGPLNNVLKIKPPLVFNGADADFFVATLDTVLSENSARH